MKTIPTILKNISITVFSLLTVLASVSCSQNADSTPATPQYDSEDSTIIAYLKVHDLLVKKFSEFSHRQIEHFKEVIGMQAFSSLLNLDFTMSSIPQKREIQYFFNKYKTDDTFYTEALETDISSELWAYFDQIYSDEIPSKAQDGTVGRYYTISELKQKYPEYDEFNLEGFRPMELINTVINEDFFGASLYADGEFNLYTLYVYYVEYKPKVYISPGRTPYKDPEYVQMIIDHVGNPTDVEVDSVLSVFYDMCSRKNSWYTNDTEGFKNFIIAYYETDLFSGADLEYVEE